MGVKRALWRGTFLALTGVGGWLVERNLSLVGRALASLLESGALPVAVDPGAIPPSVHWGLACVLGVVAGDLFSVLVGDGVSLGKWVGILKGLIAAGLGTAGLYVSDGNFLWLVGSIWISMVLSDLLDL
jgi:hypothetical protein